MKRSAAQHFNAIASRYANSEIHANSPTIGRLHQLLAARPATSVCDVACGPGHLALSFAGKASRIVGVDAAPNMLRQFAKLGKELGVKVEAVRSYAEALPFPDNSFDAVVSRLAPHHFPDIGQAVQEMARVAKAGGVVAVIDLAGDENPTLDELNHEIESLHDPTHVRSLTAAHWRDLFLTNGLAVEILETEHTEIPAGLSIRRWCEIGNTAPESQAKIRRRLAATPKEHLDGLGIRFRNDDFCIPVRTLLITGRKG